MSHQGQTHSQNFDNKLYPGNQSARVRNNYYEFYLSGDYIIYTSCKMETKYFLIQFERFAIRIS